MATTITGTTIDVGTNVIVTDAAGKVGIGTASPARALEVYSTQPAIKLNNGTNAFTIGTGAFVDGSNSLVIYDEGVGERMRIDSSGNVLVGKATTALATVGLALGGAGFVGMTRDGYEPLSLNRLTSDGAIANFYKDGTVVGSIGAASGVSYFGGTAGGLMFNGADINPTNGTGTRSDNTNDIGASSWRFQDIYATNGTIQTSDRNEKQDELAITTAESNVATACKGLLRSFRWKSAVAEKGDDARIHFGIIAQDLQDAFTAEGLDAGRYAMFISSTWWETQTEVPAVEAVDEVTDEDGNVTTEAVEAKDAYTRTDTFDTLEDAPEGATERTRMGVRYPELLSFIIAAI